MENKSLKTSMEMLCDMQIEFWKNLKNSLATTPDDTEEVVCAVWHECFRKNNEAVQKLIAVKQMIDKIEQ